MFHADRLDLCKGFAGLEITNDYIRGAAELTRSYMIDQEPENSFSKALTLTTIARLIWSQDAG